jgi:hypothetical protein
LRDSCFLDSVNELEARGHYRDRLCLGCYFFEIFFHLGATGLGLAADRCTLVCNYFSMTWRPLGTAGTGSVWDDIFLKFFFHFEASGLDPAVD